MTAAVQKRSLVARLARWWVAAAVCWLLGLMFSEIAADGIAQIPQADQAMWVLVFRLLPLGPLLATFGYLGLQVARRRWSAGLGLRCARIVLIGGIVLIAIATPKPS